jgi:hypothetical protein
MNLKISLDLDGTIFDWDNYYQSKFGIPKSDFEITKNVMGILRKDKQYWLEQPILNIPNFIPNCYCTSRVIPKRWITDQIKVNDLPKAPVYQVFGFGLSKYSQLKRSQSSVHVDDSISVFKDLNSKGIPCLLLDSPNNKDWGPIGRIYSLDIDEIEEVYDLFIRTMFPCFKELI